MNALLENMKTRQHTRLSTGYDAGNGSDRRDNWKRALTPPQAWGMQSPIIIAATNKAVRDQLSDMNAKKYWGPNWSVLWCKPVVLIVLANRERPISFGRFSRDGQSYECCTCGRIRSCWIHRAKEVFDSKEGKKRCSKEWGIEGDYEGIGHCVLGYALKDALLQNLARVITSNISNNKIRMMSIHFYRHHLSLCYRRDRTR